MQPRQSSTPKAGKGAVKLVHNEKRGAASFKPPPNAHRLAEARMKSVSDARFSLLFAGSMSPFRAAQETGKSFRIGYLGSDSPRRPGNLRPR
jgi:hypothetical protein